MTQLTQTLPLLPLTSGVVLPGMVFTMALETEEAKAAADAAGSVGGRLVLVPHIEGHYAAVGVVAEIVELGELPGGPPAMVVHGTGRAQIGTAVPGTGRALWVQVDPVTEQEPSAAAAESAREYRAVLENILLSRGARPLAEPTPRRHRAVADRRPRRLLPRPLAAPEGPGPRDDRPRAASAPGAGLGTRHARRPHPARADQEQRGRGHGAHAA